MNYKRIMVAIIVGFCLIFVGSVLGSISSFYVNHATSQYRRADITAEDYYDALDRGNVLNFTEQLLQIIGGLGLSVFSAVGAFTVEDKYARLGLLLFSALVASLVLTGVLFRLASIPICY